MQSVTSVNNINVMRGPDLVNLLRDKIDSTARQLLPAYMMYTIGLKAKEKGLLLREDYFIHIQKHMTKITDGIDDLTLMKIANETHDRATKLLSVLSADNPIAILYVVLYTIMKAVDEHVISDIHSQPVLYSTLMINESEDMGFETTFSKAWVKQKAGEMFSTIYYNKWY